MPEILGTSKNIWNFDPRSIPACALWLDAADQSTITLSGTSVTQMKDKSSNSYTLTGSSGTYPTQTNTLNGLSVISTAVGKYLSISSFNQNFTTGTCFMVMRPTEDITPTYKLASGYPGYLVVNGIGTGAIGFGVNYANQAQTGDTTKFTAYFNKSGTGLVYGQLGGSSASTYNPINTTLLMCCVMSGTTTTNASYVNGSSVTLAYNASGTFPSQTPSVQIFGHPTVSFGYDFAECILYGSTLTRSEIQQIEGYLAWKWGIESVPQSPTIPGVVPSSISGLSLWLDGADPAGTGVTPANGATVSTWVDKSGSGNNATGGVSPTYSTSAQAITFNGTSSYLQTSVTAVPVNETVFAVFTPTVLPTVTNKFNCILGTNANNGRDFNVLTNASSGSTAYQLRYDSWAVGSIALTSYGAITYNTLTLATGQYTGGQGAGSTNGSSFGAFQSLSFSGAGTTRIGGGNGGDYFTGTINEIIIYNTVLTTTQRQQIESYLSTKWGVPMVANGYTPLLNSPVNIPGCMLWLDAADTSSASMTLSGNIVTSWKDKSGNARNGTGSNSPVLTTNQQAGLPVITLASASSQFFDFGNTLNLGTGGLSIFFVGKATFGVNQGLIGKSSARGLAGRWTLIGETANPLFFAVDAAAAGTSNASIASTGTSGLFALYSATMDRTTSNFLYVNGGVSGSVAFSNSTNFSTTDKLYVGAYQDSTGLAPLAGYYYNGTIGEIIVYNIGLNTTQRQAVERYLSLKWGLSNVYTSVPGSLPGLQLWLDGADPSTLTLSGTNVTQWADKSGNGYSPTGTSVYPVYSSSSNCVTWNGTSNTQLTFPVGISNAVVGTSFSIFIVELRTYGGGDNFIIRGSNTAANSNLLIGHINATTRRFAYYANDLDATVTSYVTGEPRAIGYYEYSKPGRAIYVNGKLASSDANTSDLLSWSGAMVGGGGAIWPPYYGSVFEILMYKPSINTAQRQVVEGYLSRKWGFTTPTEVLPATHPFETIPPSLRTFNPIDVGVDLALWLDAADASTIQLSGASNVVSWKDKSPNAYLLSNTTTASQPTYVTSGLNKSYPCVRVNGSVTGGNQFLSTPLFTGLTTTTWDMYAVVAMPGTQNALVWFDPSDRILILAGGSGGNGAAYSIHWGSGGSGSWRLGPGIGATTTLNAFVYQLYSTGSLLGRRINGVVPGDTRTQTASQSYGVVSSAKPLFLCNPGSAWSTGDSFIGEMLIFSNVLTDTQRQRVEGYLSDKWGLLTSHIPTGFSPTSIAGCQLWFDASDTASITPSSITTGTKVSQWNDKSGNARHMSNATSASQPTYSTSNVAGSLPSVYFTGAADASTNANILSNSASTVFNSTTWDMYSVFKPTSQYYETAIFWNDPNVAVVLICGSSSISPTYSVHYSGWRLAPTDGPCRANEVQVYQVYSTGTTLGRRVNGAFDGTVAQTVSYSWPSRSSNSELAFTRPSTSTWTSGNTSLCEIIVYNTVLSDANRSNVQSYLTNKWYVGTGVQLGNPFYTFPPSTAVPWLPTNITGCFLWLDGADTTTLVLNGSNVTNWFDKSGNGFAAVSQFTPATLVQSSFGGNTNLLFNGASRYFCPTTAISNAGYTIFTVQNTTSAGGGGGSSGYQRVINADPYVFVGVSNGYVATFTGSGSSWNDVALNTPQFYNVNTNVLVSMSVSNAVLTPYVNGIAGTTKTGTTGAFSNFYIGDYSNASSVQPWYGNISEIIVYNGILTTSQRQQVEGYLSWKWGLISSAAPSDSMKLLFWADQCRSTTNNTLSTINTYASLFINKLALPVGLGDYSGTTLTLPYTGGYLIEISGWRCGEGSGQTKVVATRNGTTVYQRIRSVAQADCGTWIAQYYWNLFQAGDVLTLYKNDNNAGTGPIGTTTSQNSASGDERGPVKIWFIQ